MASQATINGDRQKQDYIEWPKNWEHAAFCLFQTRYCLTVSIQNSYLRQENDVLPDVYLFVCLSVCLSVR